MSAAQDAPLRIACFVTPHGLGHAARAAAVLEALGRTVENLHVELFTRTPPAFFRDSLTVPFTVHELETDIGLVQTTPYREDLAATRRKLEAFLPFDPARVAALAAQLARLECRCVLCDIAPLGLAAAREAGLPAVLIENFTWDWIYEGYANLDPAFGRFAAALRDIFEAADFRAQTAPVCRPRDGALQAPVVSRRPRRARADVRRALGLREDLPLILISTGGLAPDAPVLARLAETNAAQTLVAAGEGLRHRGAVRTIPNDAAHYHPDLVGAADFVVGKVGYSTLAEVYRAGVPFGYVPRTLFRESAPLEAFIRERVPGMRLTEDELARGEWLDALPPLLARGRTTRKEPNGADVIAAWLHETVLQTA